VLLGKAADRTLYVLDVRRLRGTPQQVQALVRHTAEADGPGTPIVMEQEPGSAGVTVIDHYLRLLQGYTFYGQRSTGSKADRALPLAAQAEGGVVKLLRGPWNKDFLDEVELFPLGRHDDAVDAASLALTKLAWVGASTGWPELLVPGRRDAYGPEYGGGAGRSGALGYGDEGPGWW
jgi:predicted phage terminase large subunit-like protein